MSVHDSRQAAKPLHGEDLPADWAGAAVRPVDADTAFNGYLAAQVVFALDRLGALDKLIGYGTVEVAGLVPGSDRGMLEELLQAGVALGHLRRIGDVVGLTEAGRAVAAMRGYFSWGVGGYSELFEAAPALIRGERTFGEDVRRDEAMVAHGSGQNDASFMAGTLDRVLAGLDFRDIADLGSGASGRLIRVVGDTPGAVGLGLDISRAATDLARSRIADAGMAGRVDAECVDVLSTLLTDAHRDRLARVDLVMSFFLLHDLLAPEATRPTIFRRLREAFPNARRFVLADTMLRPESATADTVPVFSVGYELAHALMGVPLHARETYEELFADAGLRVEQRIAFGTPHSWLYVLEAS